MWWIDIEDINDLVVLFSSDFECPASCPEIYNPVCGSDCNNYNNECELKVEACYTHNHDLKVKHEGECCCDKSSFCSKYATEDVCADKTGDIKKKWVQERCQKTCGLCGTYHRI